MTEPIAVDTPPKSVAGLPPKPAVVGGAPISATPVSPPPKADAPKMPAVAKPVSPPPLPAPAAVPVRPPAGKPSFLRRLTRKQAAIGASALFSLAAGIAGVRLMSPGDEPEPPAAPRTLAPDTASAPKAPAVEEVPPELIAPAGLPMPGAGAPAAPIPYPPGSPAASTPPAGASSDPPPPEPLAPPAAPPKVVPLPGAGPIAPAAPPTTGDMSTPIPKPPARSADIPEPDPLGEPPLIPIAGMQPAKSEPMKPEPPAVPALPGTPSLPAVPGLPGTPKVEPAGPKVEPKADPIPKVDPKAGPPADPMLDPPGTPPVKLPPLPGSIAPAKDKEPDKPVVGLPPVPGAPVAPGNPPPVDPKPPVAPPPVTGGTTGMGTAGGATPPPIDLNPTPPAKLPPTPPPAPAGTDTGTRMEFHKAPGSPTVTPTSAANDRAPTTSYDVDIYTPRTGDTWEAISREFYNDTRFAAGLRAYNRNRGLVGNSPVDVPPIHVVKRYMPAPTPPGTGSPGAGSGGFTPAGDWGAAPPPARPASERLFRVPTGGMSMRAVARITLGSEQRFDEIYRLNPHLRPDEILPAGTELQLPPNARNP
jgi:hypothetical protein